MWLPSIFKKNTAANEQYEEERDIATKAIRKQPPTQDRKVAPAPQHTEPQPANSSSTNQIRYDEKLIPQLKSDHVTLLALCSSVANMIAANNWEAIPSALSEARVAMYDHLLTEGVKLYSYMRRNLAEDPALFDLYRTYKKEMDEIGRVAFVFFDKYQNTDWLVSPEGRPIFQIEFDNLCKVLVDRITREENILYPLYMPASDY